MNTEGFRSSLTSKNNSNVASNMDLQFDTLLLTLAVNIFFKKSFKIKNHSILVLSLLFFGSFPELQIGILPILFSQKEQIEVLAENFDPQDLTNFVLAYFAIQILQYLESQEIWTLICYLSLFQIIRKPDFLKNFIRPLRVGLAPVSVILTFSGFYKQVMNCSGFISIQVGLGFLTFCFSFFASVVLRPDNHEILKIFTLKTFAQDQLKGPHAISNMISTFICFILSKST